MIRWYCLLWLLFWLITESYALWKFNVDWPCLVLYPCCAAGPGPSLVNHTHPRAAPLLHTPVCPVRFTEKISRNTVPANLLWEKKHCSDWKNKLKKTDYKISKQGCHKVSGLTRSRYGHRGMHGTLLTTDFYTSGRKWTREPGSGSMNPYRGLKTSNPFYVTMHPPTYG